MTSPDDLLARLGRWSAGRGPLYLLLAGRIRRLIDDGELPAGTPLPPDRTLASALVVGRTTVVAAYDVLAQDGKIIRRQGSGTRVAPAALRAETSATVDSTNPLFLHLLEPLDQLVQLTCAAPTTVPPAVAAAYTKALSLPIAEDIGYHPAGHPLLRQAIADRFTGRGLPTSPGQVLVTTGAQQGLALLAKLLVGPGDRVIVEAPTYPGALEVFRESAAVFRPVPPGDVAAVIRVMRSERPSVAYLIPSYHNPTGAVMPALARRRLASAAAEYGVRLIEDEVLTDLGFTDEQPLPVAAYGTSLTVGSLSKVVWGGLRVGWVRGPEPMIMQLARLKAVHDLGGNIPSQLAAVSLVEDLDSLRAQRVADLRERHSVLCEALTARLPEWEFSPALGGQCLWVKLPRGDATSFAQLVLRHGIVLLPGSSLDVSGNGKACLRLPFLVPPPVLADVVDRLATAWREYVPASPPPAELTSLVV